MIATWMLSAVLFAMLLGTAAHCAEIALRAAGRQARWAWLAALAASVTGPVLAAIVRRTIRDDGPVHTFAARLPTLYVVPDPMPASVQWAQRLDVMLLALWAVATLVMLARLGRGLRLLSRVRRAASSRVVDGVPVLLSVDIGPAVIGVRSPAVLIPESVLELDEPHRRLVLAHEREHCRARDPWLVLGSSLALSLLPWNLPLWWIARRARLALEIDCDARVLGSTGNANEYGKLILLLSQRQTRMVLSPMLAASTSHLERRIIAMRDAQLPRRSSRIALGIAGAIIVAGAACASRIEDGVAGPAASGIVATRSPVAIDPDQVLFEFQVERAAQQVPGTGNVRYPDSLKQAAVEGEVIAQFVVDRTGRYEDGSFKAVKSSHPLFASAVERALPNMRFHPAEVGGKSVRQLVQQPFTFALSKDPGASSETALVPANSNEFREFTVDRMATPLAGLGIPRYPDSLRTANVSGEVLTMFVVNADGSVDPGTLKVVKSSHPLFTNAVRNALPEMRFQPAMVKGRAVRQLVQMPYAFSIGTDGERVGWRVEYLPPVMKPIGKP